jgi:MraZ protein
MTSMVGEYLVKMDGKSRIQFPSAFRRQLTESDMEKFYFRKGDDGCLELYPATNFEAICAQINQMPPHRERTKNLQRRFNKGAVEAFLDSTNRILIPKELLKYAEITDECSLFARGLFIEVWDKDKFEKISAGGDEEEYLEAMDMIHSNLLETMKK